MSDKRETSGQFAPSQADRKADGVISAKPTVVTGSEDATAHRNPPGRRKEKDWDVGFDDREPDRSTPTPDKGGSPSETPDPDVADPHPGSVSDGTHPEADEVKTPRPPGRST